MSKSIKIKNVPKSNKNPVSANIPKPTDVVSWRISTCDKERWTVIGNDDDKRARFNDEIIPFLMEMEKNPWSYWLTQRKKKCHKISIDKLNKCAVDRLDELEIEIEEVLVMHLSGTNCLYGYIMHGICYILWYDDDHGDNYSCVCRSALKHT